MRRRALIIWLVLVVSGCSNGASSGSEKTYPFRDVVKCFRQGGLHIYGEDEFRPASAEAPHDLQVGVLGDQGFVLIFFKTVGLAKERDSLPPLPSASPPGINAKLETERRRNVLVSFPVGDGFPPLTPKTRRIVTHCLPKD